MANFAGRVALHSHRRQRSTIICARGGSPSMGPAGPRARTGARRTEERKQRRRNRGGGPGCCVAPYRFTLCRVLHRFHVTLPPSSSLLLSLRSGALSTRTPRRVKSQRPTDFLSPLLFAFRYLCSPECHADRSVSSDEYPCDLRLATKHSESGAWFAADAEENKVPWKFI